VQQPLTILITLPCNILNFDGVDDYVNFKNNYALNTGFSIELWIKSNNTTTSRQYFSKRIDAGTAHGYDLVS
jgi:hypothetical protein